MKLLAQTPLPSEFGTFDMYAFESGFQDFPHIVLKTQGKLPDSPVVRVHSECMTGDVFFSSRCDCGAQLHYSLEQIAKMGGILVYLRQEGRGIGIVNKMHAYNLQDQGFDTYAANEELGFHQDSRDFGVAAEMLRFLDVKEISLLTNNPKKVEALKKCGINIVKRLPVEIRPTAENLKYLKIKKEKSGHYLKYI